MTARIVLRMSVGFSCSTTQLLKNVLQVEDSRAPSLAGCYGDTYTTLLSLNFRLHAYSSVAKTIDAKVLTG